MSLYITSLNSGSNGNCYYVGNAEEAVLVDVGISCREVEKRMRNLELEISRVKAIFITHEHTDHISGVEVLAKKHQIPVYITPAVYRGSRIILPSHLVCDFVNYKPITVGALQVTPFEKEHDAVQPCSFMVEGNGIKIGVITDIGTACEKVVHYFKQCHAAFLESNYDEEMLEEGGYPFHLKRRIRGGKGHLSNVEALQLFLDHRPPFMSHLILSHLSKNNNTPQTVHELFTKHANGVNVVVASRYKETPVYRVTADAEIQPVKHYTPPFKPEQLQLFA
jgi:phosphoribosyl 1,2-cyclic phosphodiesterase